MISTLANKGNMATPIPNMIPTKLLATSSVVVDKGAASSRSSVPVLRSRGMITGPADEAVKKVIRASNLANEAPGVISLLTEKEKNIKNGIKRPNMIIGGVR